MKETVFNHLISELEQKKIIGGVDKEKYISAISQNLAYADIAYLYRRRGNMKEAEKYINKCKDVNAVSLFWRTITRL